MSKPLATNSRSPLQWVSVLVLVAAVISPMAHGLDATELAQLLEVERQNMAMPGLRAAVHFPDGKLVAAATGLADVEANIPLNNTIGMPGGSTGKTFVAALTMVLVEDGLLSLDDPASKWLGDSAWFQRLPNAETMKVRHLLSHSAGLADYIETARFHTATVWRVLRHGSAKFEPVELIGYVAKRRPQFEAGQGYHYTDAGYLVLGKLIEAASGETYYDLLRKRILEPQGLDLVVPADQSVLPNISPGYMHGARNLRDDGTMKLDPSSEWTGGGLTTTPTMLVKFFSSLAAGKVVSEHGFTQMVDGGWQDPETPQVHYGFGLFVDSQSRTIEHGGLWPGYRTHVWHDLKSGISIAVQTNRDGRLDLESLVGRIKDRAVHQPTLEARKLGRQ